MKINTNNSNIANSDKTIKRNNVDKSKEVEKDTSGVKYKDRVELSGDSTNRSSQIDKNASPYSSETINNESKVTKNLNHISQNENLSPEKIAEIKDRINKGFYDSDEVIENVAKIISQDIKKVDKNI